MRKFKMLTMLCAAIMVFAAAPVLAIPTYGPNPSGWTYASPIDNILGYEALPNSGQATEVAFATDVVSHFGLSLAGLAWFDGGNAFGQTSLNLYDPGFPWVFAVIKVNGPNDYSYLIWDTQAAGGDDLLTTPLPGQTPWNMGVPPNGPYGISHVSFFVAVPEPYTLLLLGLGLGLVGVAGMRRFRK